MKKRILSFVLVFVMTLGFLPTLYVANAATYGDLTYSVSNGNITITDCKETATSVTIPSEIGGYPVTAIGRSTFFNCDSLVSVTIPDSVTTIGAWAFEYSDSLSNIIIPDSVTSMGNGIFYKCTGLTSVTVGNGVTAIGDNTFSFCENLTSITIGDGVTSIGENAFSFCKKLTRITIGNSVTSIGKDAFIHCESLVSVTLGNGVTSIGEDAFDSCDSLENVYITDLNAWYNISFKNIYSNPLWNAKNFYLNNEIITDIVIPQGVTEIKEHAFYSCDSLVSVTIPDSVTKVNDYAFSSCDSLETVKTGNGMTLIGKYAFNYCKNIKYVILGASIESIDVGAFDDCEGIVVVCYVGSEADREKIKVYSSNTKLTEATWVYNYNSEEGIPDVEFEKNTSAFIALKDYLVQKDGFVSSRYISSTEGMSYILKYDDDNDQILYAEKINLGIAGGSMLTITIKNGGTAFPWSFSYTPPFKNSPTCLLLGDIEKNTNFETLEYRSAVNYDNPLSQVPDSRAVEEYKKSIHNSMMFLDSMLVEMGLNYSWRDYFDPLFFCSVEHKFNNYVSDGNATTEADGTKTRTCIYCKTQETVQDVGSKLPTSGSSVEIKDSTTVFTDIKAGKWYTNAVNYAYSHGFIAGVSNTEFGRDVPVTRGMFITILARIAGVNTSKTANKVETKFTDVKSGKYYTAAIKWASENNIVSGLSKTAFGPETSIERQQLCTMIVNFAKFMKVELTVSQAEVAFADGGSISKYAKTAVKDCQIAGIVSGYAAGSGMEFKPKNTATRAEAAQILYKFHKDFIAK